MKQFKDPIYGYIEVESEYIPIINSAEFQRLRNIRQTSYVSLYPSALHNRFVHSLGVFHLGKKAILHIRKNSNETVNHLVDTSFGWKCIKETFILACLLHDVGHAPFSHTGEDFYEQSTIVEQELDDLIHSTQLNEDLIKKGYGKPHEAMSAIVGIMLLEKNGFAFNKEFFARAIMGTEYSSTEEKYQILNGLISILNGNLIDVDKLDYLMRDAYVTGYSTMKIDYERLLSGYIIVKVKKGDKKEVYKSAFKKGALSIIENITYANDLERRWIQNNPTIIYDSKLIEQAIIKYNEYMQISYKAAKKYKNVFNKVAISKVGYPSEEHMALRLLSDDDIVSYLKNIDWSIVGQHYFSRNERYKPLWKSEAEYKRKVKNVIGPDQLEKFVDIVRTSIKETKLFFINIDEEEKMMTQQTGEAEPNKNKYETSLKLLKFFEKFAEVNKLDFKFAIARVNTFSSNRQKMEKYPIYISLAENDTATFKELMYEKETSISSVNENKMSDLHLFYVFTSKENLHKARENGKEITKLLTDFIHAYEKWE